VDVVAFRSADLPGALADGIRAVGLFEDLAQVPHATEYGDLSGRPVNPSWAGLAGALYFLAYAQWDSGQQADAVRSLRNRVRVFEQLAAGDPAAYQASLRQSLADEIGFLRSLAAAAPQQYAQSLADAQARFGGLIA
jgi:hypothetical protein